MRVNSTNGCHVFRRKSSHKRDVPEVLVRFARQLVREHGVADDDRLTERFSHRLRTTASDMNKEREEKRKDDPDKKTRKDDPDKKTFKAAGKKKRADKDREMAAIIFHQYIPPN